ncbi:dehydrogenase/reductase SDR family member 9-like [Lethenteron reissneri]|uniref:dehydrogenase/reductase SDR family member 9-like n=1 Tax=Lethenteron reissneri TaxID=7753 RepID=UPI002AB629AA|nr:dehydrogenase/reductase SDR family member 9-like [Lethenteron reissneri]XP_061419383.1 dehydrogenase/reductase SDR family member 9-like [Lethenteron reissneri]XP_061419384.1 dehydrogenase/reductase SDR family member 9-like [Lethenteron reissneri]XP_061419385.1 dehydrogenase/reductase SDR family member 9-like [Lethenteron reissneri]
MYILLLALLPIVAVVVYFRSRERNVISNTTDKYVFITGCDTGFGELLAKRLDVRGFHVIAACFTEEGQNAIKAETSQRLKTVSLDVTNNESVKRAAEAVQEIVGDKGLWGLVNNAGVCLPVGPVDWLTIEHFRPCMEVNAMGLVAVTLACLPMLKRGRGRVVNIASVLGRLAMGGGSYSLSKFCVEAFSDILRRDVQVFGIKVVIIEPGFFKTNLTDDKKFTKCLRDIWATLPKDTRHQYGEDFIDKVTEANTKNLGKLVDADISKVPIAVERALTSARPFTRYSVGWDATLFWLPLSYAPTFVIDYLLTREYIKPANV